MRGEEKGKEGSYSRRNGVRSPRSGRRSRSRRGGAGTVVVALPLHPLPLQQKTQS